VTSRRVRRRLLYADAAVAEREIDFDAEIIPPRDDAVTR